MVVGEDDAVGTHGDEGVERGFRLGRRVAGRGRDDAGVAAEEGASESARVRGAPSNGGAVVRLEDSADVLVVVETVSAVRHLREEEDVERVVGGEPREDGVRRAHVPRGVAVRGVHLNARHLQPRHGDRRETVRQAERRASDPRRPRAGGGARGESRASSRERDRGRE